MMHYRKAENVEKELSKSDLPFEDCMPTSQKDFLWMHVKGGTKVSNVIEFAQASLNKGEHRCVVWSGSGGGVVKTISCAEVLKRSHPVYQVTRMAYTSVEEHWKPQMEGLEEIIVNRQIPTLHILMSLDELPDSIEGLQKPNTSTDFWEGGGANPKPQHHQQQQQQQHQGSSSRPSKRNRSGRNKPSQQHGRPVAEENQPTSQSQGQG
ncbi:ribonuclease P protein subunit p25-like protein [Drosophila biarmipes]|uniref:ribonuclease P protein subunit p25-like protein n=1 Tax=Drosophila biarmipes TaxID=125945 RepID=UPI0007E8A984|nr:ribonuclease P protein subunit p25-like protein [Drosophila biarmipes]XP_016958129.1 ribonuclease P protein subunit p25-like protein [Drosophila biarmipes]XP_050743907.1 ribonuclease P protein subunit p25-like protein [Drosophila biarmipes]